MIMRAHNNVRVSVESAFKGCLLGHAIAAQRALRSTDKKHWVEAEIPWPHEVFYAQMVVCNYIKNKGRLDRPSLEFAINQGLAVEHAQCFILSNKLDQEGEAKAFKRLEAKQVSNQVALKFRGLDFRRLNHFHVGGPGLAAHIISDGLINHNNLRSVISDAFTIGELTHHQSLAVSGGAIVAWAISLAVTHGNDPDAILFLLNKAIADMSVEYHLSGMLKNKMTRVARVYRQKFDTARGIKELGTGKCRTAIEVIPAAIYAALNGPLSFEGLLKGLKEVDNYKFWAIAGAIRGAMIGYEGIPQDRIKNLEHHEDIIKNAEELFLVTVS
jgi:hypothetical protein